MSLTTLVSTYSIVFISKYVVGIPQDIIFFDFLQKKSKKK